MEKKEEKVYILSRSLVNYLTPSQPLLAHDTTSAKQLAIPHWGEKNRDGQISECVT